MIKVHNVNIQDLPNMAALEQQSFSNAWDIQALAETFLQEHSFMFAADEEGQLKGYCVVYSLFEEAELARIAVEESTRKKGVGDLLMEELFKQCKERQIHRIILEVRGSNEAAVGLYKKHGFEAFAVRKAYYHHPEEDGIMMEKLTI
ncbi:MAG: ribosomal protein S18-alanine N-acetyltransferase [Lachnospiraceae bacterium]